MCSLEATKLKAIILNYLAIHGSSLLWASLTEKLLLIWWVHVSFLFCVSCGPVLISVHLMEQSSPLVITERFFKEKTFTCEWMQRHSCMWCVVVPSYREAQ